MLLLQRLQLRPVLAVFYLLLFGVLSLQFLYLVGMMSLQRLEQATEEIQISLPHNNRAQEPRSHRVDLMARRTIAISGVRNEGDIIEAFVRHTAALVDHLMIMDNGSADGTREILTSLAAEGLPVIVQCGDSVGQWQARWMTALMAEAVREPEAEWILPLDADEFLPAKIHALLAMRPSDAGARRPVRIPVRNYVPDPLDDSGEKNPVLRMHHYLVQAPEESPWKFKIIVPAELARMPDVSLAQGNHDLIRNGELLEADFAEQGFFLAHFPVRTVEQFTTKIAVGWLQYLTMSKRSEGWGFHKRAAYERLRKDSTVFARNFRAEALLSCLMPDERSTPQIADDRADYLGGPLKYSPETEDEGYALAQLLRYAEELARQHARLTAAIAEHTVLERRLYAAEEARDSLAVQLETAAEKRKQLTSQLQTTTRERAALEQRLRRTRQSFSWRLTATLRETRRVCLRLLRWSSGSSFKHK